LTLCKSYILHDQTLSALPAPKKTPLNVLFTLTAILLLEVTGSLYCWLLFLLLLC